MRAIRERKYLLLLLVMIAMLALQPLIHGYSPGTVLYDFLFTLLGCQVVVVVFQGWKERLVSGALMAIIVVSLLGIHDWLGDVGPASVIVYHATMVVFLGLAVTLILRGIFRQEVIHADTVLGVCCGYALAGAVWGNLYVLVEVLSPGSFAVSERVVWELSHRHSRRFLFQYFSFSTLTTVGYGDITPVSPVAAWLACLEAIFGQFYIAVVVAQLVGLKLAQVAPRDRA